MEAGWKRLLFLFGTEKKLINFIFFLKFAIDNISSQLYILSHPLKTKEQNKKILGSMAASLYRRYLTV